VKPLCWVNVNAQGDVTHHQNKKSSWARTPVFAAPVEAQATVDELLELREEYDRLLHNYEVMKNALWKACGDDEDTVNDTIESQGVLK